MAGATFTIPLITVIPGQLITAALWNNEWQNIDVNFNPSGMDGYEDNDSQMQIQTDPYPGSVTSHATSLGGEIERIRYQLNLLIGKTYWYEVPALNMASIVSVPLGGMIPYFNNQILPLGDPNYNNFLLADGRAISRVNYAALNNIYGATAYPFGTGDGSTTFNLPDMRDKFMVGAGNLYGIGAGGGEATHLLTTAEIPAVTVTDPGHGHGVTDPGHGHYDYSTGSAPQVTNGGSGQNTMGRAGLDHVNVQSGVTGVTVNSNTTGITVAGGGTAHNNLPPYIGMYWLVRVL